MTTEKRTPTNRGQGGHLLIEQGLIQVLPSKSQMTQLIHAPLIPLTTHKQISHT